MTERFIIDTCGTLIDMETRNTYDYVNEVQPLLNQYNQELERCKDANTQCVNDNHYKQKRIIQLEKENKNIKNIIKEALANERTELGKSVLKQLINNLED